MSQAGAPAPRDDESRDPLDLLAEQFLQRVRSGSAITPQAFAAEHPAHQQALLDLLPTLALLEQAKRDRETAATGARRASVPLLERLGEFAIVRELGRGGMGVVFEAVQESLGRRVALKVLPQASLLSGHQLERFRREAQVAANLHHTHIVPVFGCGEADGYHYYAMQFIDGRGLDAVVRELRDGSRVGAPLLPTALLPRCAAVAKLGADVAVALQYSHELGTLHRDIKPANLLLEPNGHVWIADFGLAKALQHDGLTNSGDVLGTLQYLAPEQLDGQYDERSEVYALGLVLYELLALQPAFAAASRTELLDKIRAGRCEPLRRCCPDVPLDLATIVERALAAEPVRRYASAAALAADLRAFVDDRPIAARRTSRLEHAWRWCRRNRALSAVSMVAVLATVAAAVVGWTAYLITDEARTRAETSAADARTASTRAENNVTLFSTAFEDIFDGLVGPDPLHAIVDESDDADGGSTVALRAPVDQKDAALLQRMLTFYDKFAAQNANSKGLVEQTARAYRRLGGIQARLGDDDAAIAAYQKALAGYRDVHERDVTRDLAAVQQELGQVQLRHARLGDAMQSFRQSLQLLDDDVADRSRAARLLEARGHFLLAYGLDFRSGGPGGRGGGGPLGRRGQPPDDAQGPPGGRRGQPPDDAQGPPNGRRGQPPDDAQGPPNGRRGGRGQRPEQLREARVHLRQARDLLAGLQQEAPDDVEVQFLLARVLLFDSRPGLGNDRGKEQREQAIAMLQQLVEQKPDNDTFRFELADALLPPPGQLLRGDDVDVDTLRKVAGHARKLVELQPEHPEYKALLGRSLSMLGSRELAADPAAAERDLRAALDLETALVAAAPKPEPRFVMQLLMTRRMLVRALLDQKKLADARALLTQFADDLAAQLDGGKLLGRIIDDQGPWDGLLKQFENAGLGARAQQLRDALERARR